MAATVALQLTLLHRVDAWTWLRVAVPVAVGVAVVMTVWRWCSDARRDAHSSCSPVSPSQESHCSPHRRRGRLPASSTRQNGTFPDARPTSSAAAGPFGGFPGGASGNLGPQAGPGPNLPPGAPQGGAPGGTGSFGAPPAVGGAGTGSLGAAELRWLDQQRRGEKWILGVQSSTEAADSIIDGYDVVALGGFSGQDAAASPARVADLVSRGELRYLAVGGFGGFGGGPGLAGSGVSLGQVVSTVCTQVDASPGAAAVPAESGTAAERPPRCGKRHEAHRPMPRPQTQTETRPGGAASPA